MSAHQKQRINPFGHFPQAKDAMLHPYFDDLAKEWVDLLEDDEVNMELSESIALLQDARWEEEKRREALAAVDRAAS